MKGDLTRPASVYMVVNKINGKRYIGITTAKRVHRRINEHFCHAQKGKNDGAFYRAIRKYGRDEFSWEIIMKCDTALEAIQQEIRLIAELKPEYNSTLGGEGRLGGYISEEGRRRISIANKGHKRSRGRKLSLESRNLIRMAQTDPGAIQRWKKYSILGPMAMARKVKCINDGKIFDSATSAAKSYNVCKSAVIEICLGKKYRKTIGGLSFKYEVAS